MIRVRFAPSPTGLLHQGNVRTALFNFLFTRHQGGSLVLRIEDTDQERSQDDYADAIVTDLQWLGLNYDEGPGRGGDYGPYRQSERLDIYKKYLHQLMESGRVYPCYCTPEEIDSERRRAMASGKSYLYSGKCRQLSEEERQAKVAAGVAPSLRFRLEREIVKFTDLVYGEKVFDTATMGDFVVARSNEMPIYLFACALDDALMKITHVIRGEDGMSNTPRQILIQKALGFESPQFAHLPLILGPDHTLLSKRNGSTPIAEFKAKGYLPGALLNYLALLGWSPPRAQEILSLTGLIEKFDLNNVARSSAIFDWDKLNHINKVYLRQLSEEEYLAMAKDFLRETKLTFPVDSEERLTRAVLAVRPNCSTLGELPTWLGWLLNEPSTHAPEAQTVLRAPEGKKVLQTMVELLDAQAEEPGREACEKLLEELKKKTKIKGKKLFMPLRIALTGNTEGPELVALLPSLGKVKTVERIRRAIEDLQHEEPK
jgi:nondiscriminating glutamyl-tRNA synthetase